MARQQVADLTARLEQAASRTAATQQAIVEAERAAIEAQRIASILTAPDLARVDLAGQPSAPNARGRAFWSRARGLVFTATNLPAPPMERFISSG